MFHQPSHDQIVASLILLAYAVGAVALFYTIRFCQDLKAKRLGKKFAHLHPSQQVQTSDPMEKHIEEALNIANS